jgi:hypothetical protein
MALFPTILCTQVLVLHLRESARAQRHVRDNRNACIPLVVMPFLLSQLGGLFFFENIHHLAQNAISKFPLHNICAGEETNTTAIYTIQNSINSDSHLLLHLALPGNIIWHMDLLTSKVDDNAFLPILANATDMLLATAPAVRSGSPNNLKDDARWMLFGCRRICTNCSHNKCSQCSKAAAHMVQYLPPCLGSCMHHLLS